MIEYGKQQTSAELRHDADSFWLCVLVAICFVIFLCKIFF